MNISNPSSYQLDFQKIRKKTQINDIQSLELYLVNIFNDLSRRDITEREEKSIDKITFIEYMKIPYIVGEKLFHVFDTNRNGLLTLTEFVSSIINLYSGGLEETQRIIFNLLDFDFDGKIIPEDSRLLIMFIKNLANPPSGIIKKLKPRTTLTDDEDLEEINILIKNFFGKYSVMNFVEFKNQIENHNSDVFFIFICFLYNNKPYFDSSIRILKQSCRTNNNLNVSSNSMINSSFDNLFKNDHRSRIKSPSKISKSFIMDLVDIDLDEIEKDCEDNPTSDNYKSDPDDFTQLTNEDCSIKSIPLFSAKINLEKNKRENDFIRTNTKNKKNFGSNIIKKSLKNYLQRKENYKSFTVKIKENHFLDEKDEERIFKNNATSHNNTFNYINNQDRDGLSAVDSNGTFIRNNITKINNDNNTFKKKLESSFINNGKITAEDDSSENNPKSNNRADGTGGPPEKIESSSNRAKALQYINKSHTDFSNPFVFRNKLSQKNATRDDNVFPKVEVLGHNNKFECNFTKNDFTKSRMSGMKLSIMSFDQNNINVTNHTNNKILSSSGNVNRYLSPDSARFSYSGEFFASDIIFEGYIYRSDENNHLKKYYTALVGNDLFYFTNSKKITLKGIHNLSGTYIFKDPNTIKVREEYANNNSKNVNDTQNSNNEIKTNYSSNSNNVNNISSFKNNDGNVNKKSSTLNINNEPVVSKTVYYYPFKLYFKKKCRIYYCASEEDVKNWVDNVRAVTKFREITDYYSIGEELGHGKFGKVKIGNPKRGISTNKLNQNDIKEKEDEKYAIKIINKVNLKSIELELVKSEIEIMKFCRYRNIVKLIENFEDHENIYIILEYLSGGNLNNYLSSQKTLLPEGKIKNLVLEIASGINYLHHFGIIHRDLKPENIMMSDKSENAIVKIVDFGLSKVLGKFEKSNEAYGTLAYAAPEVIQKNAYTKTIDIWSLGVILYFLISGQFPFNDKNNNLHKIAVEITSGDIKFIGNSWKRADLDCKELVLRCLERDVTKRIDIVNFINHKWFNK